MKKSSIYRSISSALMLGFCSTGCSFIFPQTDPVTSDVTTPPVIAAEAGEETTNQSQMVDIYDLFPVGKMISKTAIELKENYSVQSSEIEDHTKYLVELEEPVENQYIMVLADETEAITLVGYHDIFSVTGQEQDSVDGIKELYDILLLQGEELPLVYTHLEVKEAGTIPDLVTDFHENSGLVEGNYESRFNVDGIEIEVGVLYLLEPSSNAAMAFQTITFEIFEE